MLIKQRGERSDTLEGVSLSELVAFAVLVAHIPREVLLIYTVGVTVSESVDAVSYTHLRAPRDYAASRMPSSA